MAAFSVSAVHKAVHQQAEHKKAGENPVVAWYMGAMLKEQKNGGQDHKHDKCGAGPRFQKGSNFTLTLHSASRQTCPWRVRNHTRPEWHGEKFDRSKLIAVPKLIPY